MSEKIYVELSDLQNFCRKYTEYDAVQLILCGRTDLIPTVPAIPIEQKPYEKFESVKDHINKLAGDYKCWDNRLTADEALELCHILEQESIPIDRIKQLREEMAWKNPNEVMPNKDTLVDVLVDTGTTRSYLTAYWNDFRGDWEEGLGGSRLLSKDLGYTIIGWRDINVLNLIDDMLKEYEGENNKSQDTDLDLDR